MSKKILITGGTGLIGKVLSKMLFGQGHDVRILTRQERKNDVFKYYQWDLSKNFIEEGALEVDYIIHLAGAGVADKRWTSNRKKAIIDSRIESTNLIKSELSKIKGSKPGYIGASAIGIYGNSDDHPLSENEVSKDKTDFLVDVVHKWEDAHMSLKEVVSSHAILRIGIVLSKNGGALKPMLIPFIFRVGNYFGNGSQIFSWIHVEEVCKLISFIVENNLSGIYNGVAPNAVSGKALIHSIAKVKGGPFIKFGLPSFLLKLVFGEMSQAILMSTWVGTESLDQAGYQFEFPEIDSALQNLLSD